MGQKASTRGAPDRLQSSVHLEHLADRTDALSSVGAFAKLVKPAELVAGQAVSKGANKTQALSAAANTLPKSEHKTTNAKGRGWGKANASAGGVLQRLQRGIGLERLCYVGRSLRFEVIAIQTANKRRSKSVSGC